MKIFIVLLLSFLTLATLALPCCPEKDCAEAGVADETQAPEDCPPFYSCNTCTLYVDTPRSAQLAPVLIEQKRSPYPAAVSTLPSPPLLSLLQPPRSGV